jgi:hypothetical protein
MKKGRIHNGAPFGVGFYEGVDAAKFAGRRIVLDSEGR